MNKHYHYNIQQKQNKTKNLPENQKINLHFNIRALANKRGGQ
jgi:hypothetical protein